MVIASRPSGVLLLAYSYPPRGGVGSLRALRLARGLADRGRKVSVVTALGGPTVLPSSSAEGRGPGLEVLEAPYHDRTRLYRRLLVLGPGTPAPAGAQGPSAEAARSRSVLWLMLRAVVLFPDEHVGWIRGAFAKGLQRMKRGDIGAVISTSPPESTHIVAARLRRSTDVPWIADFRDPWGFSHLRDPTPMNYLHRIVEGRTIRRADALVTVTRPWAERFRALYPSLRVHSIPNGFEEELPSASCSPDPSVFRLVYTGKLDLRQQSPGIVFDAVATACAGGHIDGDRLRIAFHCYGTPEQAVREAAARSGLGTKFEWAGPLSSAKSLAVQRTADVLLIFGWQRDPGCVPAKLFDYLGSGRRILLVGRTDSEVASILRACGRGEAVESAEACRETLTRWFAEWREKGALSAGGDPDAVAQHAFRYRVDEYDRLLTELGAARHS